MNGHLFFCHKGGAVQMNSYKQIKPFLSILMKSRKKLKHCNFAHDLI